MTYDQMGLNEWLLISGALLGPVLAVQAQKWVERARESSNRRTWVFYALMATRGARLADDHVRALNSIDMVFYGFRALGKPWRRKKSQAVIDAWREYHTHLCPPDDKRPTKLEDVTRWEAKGEELFLNLLARLASATNHEFDRDVLRTGGYSPIAHSTRELQQDGVRQMALELLSGQRSLPLELRSVPTNEAFLAADSKFKSDVVTALNQLAAKQ